MCILSEYLLLHEGKLDPISFYNRKWKRYHMGVHSHDRIEIMYVTRGKCLVRTPNKDCRLNERELIILRPNVPHQIHVEDTCHIYNIEFGASRSRGILSIGELTEGLVLEKKCEGDPFDHFHDTDDIESVFAGLLTELLAGQKDSVITVLYFKLLLCKLLRLSQQEPRAGIAGDYVNQVIRYINENYNESFTMDDMAAELHLSKVYLHRIFRQTTGTTIVKYTNNLRIRKAKELLRTTNAPVTEVCFQVGNNSRQYFSSMFKKLEGCTPFEYKSRISNSYKFDERIYDDVIYEEEAITHSDQ